MPKLDLHKKSKSLLSSAGWNIASLIVIAIAGFITVPVIIREIGASNYGLYSIIIMIGGFVALQDLGLGEATLRFVAKYTSKNDLEGINRVLSSTILVYTITGTIGAAFILILSPQIVGLFQMSSDQSCVAIKALRVAGVAFFFSTFRGTLQKIPEAMQRYDVSCKIMIMTTVARCVAMIVVVRNGGGVIVLAWLLVADGILNIIIFTIVAHYLVPGIKCFPRVSREGIKEVFSYGIYSFINQLINSLATYMDRFILGAFFGANEVGFLTAPKDLLIKAQGLTGSASRALFPRFSTMAIGVEMKNLYCFSLWALTCFSVIIFIPIAVVLPVFLSLWISPEFATYSSPVARLIAIGMACNGGASSYMALLKATDRVRWLMNINLTLTVFSVFITAFLVYKYGLIGSGIKMLLFSWCGITLCMIVGSRILIGFNMKKEMFESAILPLGIGALFFFVGDYFLLLLNVKSWIELIAFVLLFSFLLALLLFITDFLIYRKMSGFNIFFKKIIAAFGNKC